MPYLILAIAAYSSSPLSDIIDIINEQGEALRLHFEAVVRGCR
jgi:hypothetical protein